MSFRHVFPAFFLPLLLLACGHGHDGADLQTEESHAHAAVGEAQGLKLNDGEKWEMDSHTRAMLAAMVERVETGVPEGDTRALGRKLEGDVEELIRGCTMTGAAHDELHTFLVPLIPAVQKLAAEGGENALREVRKLLEIYPRYFS